MKKITTLRPFLLTMLFTLAASVTHAAPVTAISGGVWNNSARWSDNTNVSSNSGKDYLNSGGFSLTNSFATRNSFQGNTLTLDGASSVVANSTAIDGNFILTNGGGIDTATTNSGIAGTLTVNTTGTLRSGTVSDRFVTIDSQLLGSGVLTLDMRGGDIFTFTNTGSTFSGSFFLTGPDASGTNVFRSTALGSLGSGSLLNLSLGTFEATYDIVSGNNSLQMTANSTFTLGDFDHIFSSVTLGATSLTAGTYNVAQLNAFSGGTFTGLNGTITVVPEPAAVALFGMASLLLLARRHRKRA